jgi:long-chain fatty acid transport protein
MKISTRGPIVLSVFLAGSPLFAAGLWLYEGGTPDVGSANAGRAALAADASTASANPAGLPQLERPQVLFALQGLYLNSRFDTQVSGFGGGNGGNAGGWIPTGSLHYATPVNENTSVGVSLGSYFGLGVKYDSNWAGRYYITEADLITFGVNPGIGYRVNDTLSIGAGFTVMYAELSQRVALNNAAALGVPGVPDGELRLEDDDIGYGYNLGVLFAPRPGTRLGLTYRSEIDLEFRDVASLRGLAPPLQGLLLQSGLAGSRLDLSMTVPQALMFSAYQEINDRWALVGNIGWQEWSRFGKQELSLRSAQSVSFTQDLDYDDTWHFALGARYRFAPEWLLSFGLAYDTSPVDSDSGRTPDLALDRQVRFATGLQYDLSEDVTIGGAYEYIDLGSAGIDRNDGPLKGPLKGDYDTNAIHVLAFNVTWRF